MEKEQPAPVEQTEHQTTGEKQAENVVPSKIVDPQSKVSKEEKELPKAPAKTENLTEKMVVESQTLKNPDLVLQLIDMGFNETLAKRAVEQTDSLEEAVNLIIIMEENDGGHISAPTKDQVKQLHYKMVIAVRTDIKMTAGKMAAQVGHGVLGAYKVALQNNPQDVEMWECIGQMKAVVRCESQKSLMDVYENAKKLGLPTEYIQDAGRTQIEPGTITVCAVGPARSDLVDQVTGHLKLY